MSEIAAPSPVAPKSRASFLPDADSLIWPLALIGLLFVLHFTMVTGRSVNWDEFWFYSQVEVIARGDWIQPLQTIHTRALFWLPALGGSEIDHIVIARLFMLACLAVIAGGIFLTAEHFTDRRTALLSSAVYLGAGFVLHHGTSFRVDPIVTALLTAGLAIAARTRLGWPAILALGAVLGLAGIVTIKMVLWLPVFAGIALWRWHDAGFSKTYPLRWVAAALVAGVVFAVTYALHSSGAAPEANASAAGTLNRAGGKMFGLLHSPYLFMMSKAAMIAMPLAIAALIVPSTVLRLDLPMGKRLALLAIWFPLLTPLFYHNSAPYVYVFTLPPVAVVSAYALRVLVTRYGEPLVAGFIAFSALAVWVVDERGVTEKQGTLIDAVHDVVPQHVHGQVHYFDCCGMIGSFTKSNEFLTMWGIEKYLTTGRADYVNAMREAPVPLLIDNNENFAPLLEEGDGRLFHPDDAKALSETYIRFWGDIFLAGRAIEAGEATEWKVRVPGTYTVEGALEINGIAYADGDFIELDRGAVRLTNLSKEQARLVWGKAPKRPQATPPDQYWTGF